MERLSTVSQPVQQKHLGKKNEVGDIKQDEKLQVEQEATDEGEFEQWSPAVPSPVWFLYCRREEQMEFLSLVSNYHLTSCHSLPNRPKSDGRRGIGQEEHLGAECLLRSGKGVFLFCWSRHQHQGVHGQLWCSDLARGTLCRDCVCLYILTCLI